MSHLEAIWQNVSPTVTEFSITVPRDVYERISLKAERCASAWKIPAAVFREELLAEHFRTTLDRDNPRGMTNDDMQQKAGW
jgi:hypothetical protein